jgi:iron complex outermembrane receptor protein
VSVDHQLSSDVLVYVKAAEGYRSGGQNESGSNSIESFASFSPETNLEYEVGVKSEYLDRRVRLNLDAYHDKYTDLQVTTAVATASGGFATPVSNAASAIIQGVELEAAAIPAPGLSFKTWIAYTDAYYNKFLDAQLGDRAGEPYTVPRWSWSLNGKYVRPTGIGDLLFELDYLWRGRMDLDGAGVYRSQITQAAVGVLDGRINLHLDRANLDVALFGRNITARKYSDQAFQLEQIGINMLFAAPPATYGLELIKKFGP